MNRDTLTTLFKQVALGEIEPEDAAERIASLPFEELDFAKIDHHRQLRRGFPEVVFAEGKSSEHLLGILDHLASRDTPILLTRVDAAKAEVLAAAHPTLTHNALARTMHRGAMPATGRGEILILSAGTSDLPVVEEAAVSARVLGNEVTVINDVGVAGLHRLAAARDAIRRATAIIVVAGMEGALASVVAGLVDVPVIGVPTSVGYGASFNGVAALLSMLNSCAGGVSVVNIDNGFGAAVVASLINRGPAALREARE
ncbi:MAG: nickel pincer cofactor biosynthesis protein LarB [Deltaproteobacteria bacterium]|nr:nickel pincer cofactor biosynthesis protein LarB [Deltaproteobacteria bacterium]